MPRSAATGWYFVACLGACALALAGCDTPNTRFTDVRFGDAIGLAAGGNLRLITERPRANSIHDPTLRAVLCSEPSPDYAVAFNRSADLTLKNVFGSSDETQAKLDSQEKVDLGQGRTAGVLALRDGLYAACQAYANGLIGQDAYSVILSQYGLLIAAVANGTNNVVTTTQASKQPAASAFAAILVACLSAHDKTRLNYEGPNSLLGSAACRRIIARAGSGAQG